MQRRASTSAFDKSSVSATTSARSSVSASIQRPLPTGRENDQRLPPINQSTTIAPATQTHHGMRSNNPLAVVGVLSRRNSSVEEQSRRSMVFDSRA